MECTNIKHDSVIEFVCSDSHNTFDLAGRPINRRLHSDLSPSVNSGTVAIWPMYIRVPRGGITTVPVGPWLN